MGDGEKTPEKIGAVAGEHRFVQAGLVKKGQSAIEGLVAGIARLYPTLCGH
jgi:hypothetical protein